MLVSLAPYIGLFATAFVAATLLPAQSEALLATMTLGGRYSAAALFAAATAGNVLGSLLNWWLGRYCLHFRDRRWFPFKAETIDKSQRWYARWGQWSLLLAWAPIVGDPLTFAAGLMRTPLKTFLPLVIVAKAGRYLLVILAARTLS